MAIHGDTWRYMVIHGYTRAYMAGDPHSHAISTGNQMISSAIWNEKARANFSKTSKKARARRASAI